MAGALDRMGLFRALLAARARAALPWRTLTVVTFHRVASAVTSGFDPAVVDASPAVFARRLAILGRYFTFIDTGDLEAHRSGAPLPDNPAMISFDDGYRDNLDNALPVLQRHKAKAVFFVATAYVDERRLFWWERINAAIARSPRGQLALAYPEPTTLALDSAAARRATVASLLRLVKERVGLDLDQFLEELEAAAGAPMRRTEERACADALVMTWDDIRALKAAGMDVQSHTHRHRVLHTLGPGEACADLMRSRRLLEAKLDSPVRAVAYPAGRPITDRPALRHAVRGAGYRFGLTCGTGAARLGRSIKCDWLNVPRLAMEGDMPEPFFRGCLAIPALAW